MIISEKIYRIGLVQTLPENKLTVIPCEVNFGKFSVTIGEGIARAYYSNKIAVSFQAHKHIEEFLIQEVNSIFKFDTSLSLQVVKFTRNVNAFLCQHISNKLTSNKHTNPLTDKFDMNYHPRLDETWQSILRTPFEKNDDPDLEENWQSIESTMNVFGQQINVMGQPNISLEEKKIIFYKVHSLVLMFTDDVLRKEFPTSYNSLVAKYGKSLFFFLHFIPYRTQFD